MPAQDHSQPDAAALTAEDPLELVRRGTWVVGAAQIGSQLISLAVLAGLYRLIDPGEFGLVNMILPVLLFMRMFTSAGLSVASVQKQDISDLEISSLFWLTVALGLLTTLATVALAPAIAWFYQTPDLTLLTVAIAGTSLVAALGAQHQAILERKLRLGRLAIIRLLAQAGGGAAGIAAGLSGWGVWSLIAQQYAEFGLLAALAWLVETWRPVSPARGQRVGPLLAFGGYYTLSSFMANLATNVDKIVLGYLNSTPRALGLYSQAFNLAMRPVGMVTMPLQGVMLPALARAANHPDAYRRLALSFFRTAAVLLFPAGVGLFVVSDEAMQVLGGPAWRDAGLLLAALCPAIFVQGFINLAGIVLASVGRADRLSFGTAAIALVLCPGYVAAWYLGRVAEPSDLGATFGVACSYSFLLAAVIFVPYMMYCLRTVDIPLGQFFGVLRRPALAAGGMGIVVWGCRAGLRHFEAPLMATLLVEMAVGVIAYLLLANAEIRWMLGVHNDG